MKTSISFCVVLTFLTLTGCVSVVGHGVQQKKYDISTFNKKVHQKITVTQGSELVSVSVFKVPGVVQLIIPFEPNEQIVVVRVRESKNLNVNRFLLSQGEKIDYIIDDDNRKLMVNLELPILYFLDGHYDLGIAIAKYKMNQNSKLYVERKNVVLNWAPRKDDDSKESGFAYYSSLAEVDGPSLGFYRDQLRAEIKRTNMDRIDKDYRSRINGFLGVNK